MAIKENRPFVHRNRRMSVSVPSNILSTFLIYRHFLLMMIHLLSKLKPNGKSGFLIYSSKTSQKYRDTS